MFKRSLSRQTFVMKEFKVFILRQKMFTITKKATIKIFERSRKATTMTSVCRILSERTHQLHLILTFQQSCNVRRIVHIIIQIDHGLTLEWYCISGVGNLSLPPGQKQTLQNRVGRTIFQPTIPFASVFMMLLEFVNFQSFDQINTLFSQFITKAYNTTYSRFIAQCAFSQVVSQMYVARKAD